MKKNLDIIKLLEGIGIVLLHFVLVYLLQIPFLLFTENIYIVTLIPYFLTMIFFIYIYRKELKNDIKDFKKNYKKILLTTLKYWIIGFAIMFISAIIINKIPIKDVLNQEENAKMLKVYPIIEILIACLIAPVTEEIVFRVSFKKFTKNKWIYAFTTGLIFGFVHVLSSLLTYKTPLMLIYLIPYGALGVVFGLAYSKTDNIYGTMVFHALHNTISILELLLIGGILLWVKK